MTKVQAVNELNRTEIEQALREDLAACYRLVAHFGWDDLTATHISARIPGPVDTFLINPLGMMFDEITASNLVKINIDGEILEPTPYQINPAGFVIHSAVHSARPDAGCVIHLHSQDGVAVSMLEEGLLALNQSSMMIADHITLHEYEGIALEMDERKRLQDDLGDKNLMILRNHGTLAVGRSVGDAFHNMYYLEWACTVQVRAMSTGRAIHKPTTAAMETVRKQASDGRIRDYMEQLSWPALRRRLDRLDPGYRD